MRVHVVPDATALSGMDLTSWTVVVIDVIRASSTIAQALASGCQRVIPTATIEEAQGLKKKLIDEDPLLGGERNGTRISGFDFGNSPREYAGEAVVSRTVILTTTNGTKAIRAASSGREVLVGCFLNISAVVESLHGATNVLIVPVGRSGAPVLDDVVCAGMFVEKLLGTYKATVTPHAQVVRMTYFGYSDRLLDALRESASGDALIKIGLGEDLRRCSEVGLLDVTPRLVGEELRR